MPLPGPHAEYLRFFLQRGYRITVEGQAPAVFTSEESMQAWVNGERGAGRYDRAFYDLVVDRQTSPS